ncbi:hypothetical protein BFP72_17735 [Reichenbachiella sp. 5M10]|uniref:hypothetical protein n=1 Tax=Reichenbachiella sp. 5M10 TaxID=1889772 RepID=UPI000C1525F6|nr:hypothetical protein [Reichenbachiella sp. 5M10]PIB37115.1 hypothetical protein BFP72_17735 [Reichenbachiella sp. 5M10]
MKGIKGLIIGVLAVSTLSCGDDSQNEAQVGKWLAEPDGVERSGCDLESNDGLVNCQVTNNSSCVVLDLGINDLYSLTIALDGNANRVEAGSYTLEKNKIILCPGGGSDCYTVPVVDSDFSSMTIEIDTPEDGCELRIDMTKI